MVDRLALYTAKSLAKFISDNVAGLDAAYVPGPDFDYDKKPDPSNPSLRIDRPLPFVTIEIQNDESIPFTMSANILYETNITFNVVTFGTGYSNLVNMNSDMKQQLRGAVHPVSGKVGIPLYDFGTPSGVFYDLVDAIQIDDFGLSSFFGPVDNDEFENRKHKAITPIVFSAFRDKDSELLENLGNINLSD